MPVNINIPLIGAMYSMLKEFKLSNMVNAGIGTGSAAVRIKWPEGHVDYWEDKCTLFAGGYNNGVRDIVYLSYPAENTLYTYSTSLLTARANLAGASTYYGGVFAGGFTTSYQSVVEYYSPDLIRTSFLALSVARAGLVGLEYMNDGDSVAFVGGNISSSSGSNAVERYTYAGTRSVFSMASARYGINGCSATNGPYTSAFGLVGNGTNGNQSYSTDVTRFSTTMATTELGNIGTGSWLYGAAPVVATSPTVVLMGQGATNAYNSSGTKTALASGSQSWGVKGSYMMDEGGASAKPIFAVFAGGANPPSNEVYIVDENLVLQSGPALSSNRGGHCMMPKGIGGVVIFGGASATIVSSGSGLAVDVANENLISTAPVVISYSE
jgi:hypothetical protein